MTETKSKLNLEINGKKIAVVPNALSFEAGMEIKSVTVTCTFVDDDGDTWEVEAQGSAKKIQVSS